MRARAGAVVNYFSKRNKRIEKFSLNWDSFHVDLNSHYDNELQQKEEDKDENYIGKLIRKSPNNKCLLELKPFKSWVIGYYPEGKEFQSLAAPRKRLLT